MEEGVLLAPVIGTWLGWRIIPSSRVQNHKPDTGPDLHYTARIHLPVQ